jgi:gluconokinase
MEDVKFVHLTGSFELIYARMQQRSDHYMKAEMLRGQFDDLEEPQNTLAVAIDQPVSEIVGEIIENLKLAGESQNGT